MPRYRTGRKTPNKKVQFAVFSQTDPIAELDTGVSSNNNLDDNSILCNLENIVNDDELVEKITEEFGLNTPGVSGVKPKGLKLIPEVQSAISNAARSHGLNDTEFVRRAIFAAAVDPSIISKPSVRELDRRYQRKLSTTKWKKQSLG